MKIPNKLFPTGRQRTFQLVRVRDETKHIVHISALLCNKLLSKERSSETKVVYRAQQVMLYGRV
jgi:hypothetical protein